MQARNRKQKNRTRVVHRTWICLVWRGSTGALVVSCIHNNWSENNNKINRHCLRRCRQHPHQLCWSVKFSIDLADAMRFPMFRALFPCCFWYVCAQEHRKFNPYIFSSNAKWFRLKRHGSVSKSTSTSYSWMNCLHCFAILEWFLNWLLYFILAFSLVSFAFGAAAVYKMFNILSWKSLLKYAALEPLSNHLTIASVLLSECVYAIWMITVHECDKIIL